MSLQNTAKPRVVRKSWTVEEDQALRQYIGDGKSYDQAAKLLNRSRWSVRSRSDAMRLPYAYLKTRTTASTFGEQIVGYLRHGLTYTQISERTGMSRGAIAGWVHRLRHTDPTAVPHRGTKPDNLKKTKSARLKKRRKANTAELSALKVKKRAMRHPVFAPRMPTPPVAPIMQDTPRWDEPVSKRLQLTDLERNQCRWVHGDPKKQHHFCGNDTREGSSYCDFHRNVCYTRDTTRLGRWVNAVAASKRLRQFLR